MFSQRKRSHNTRVLRTRDTSRGRENLQQHIGLLCRDVIGSHAVYMWFMYLSCVHIFELRVYVKCILLALDPDKVVRRSHMFWMFYTRRIEIQWGRRRAVKVYLANFFFISAQEESILLFEPYMKDKIRIFLIWIRAGDDFR